MYIWNLPTKVLFGANCLDDLKNEEMPGKKALIVISNGKSVKLNGALDKTIDALKSASCDFCVFDKVQANPLSTTLDEGVAVARENGCDFLVGVGGGSVLDATTVIAAVTPNKLKVWDYMDGGSGGAKPLLKKSLPYIEVSTSAGTGSEVDRWGVVTNPDTHEKIGFLGDFPTIAIVDPTLMLTVPADYTAYQGFDALFHSTEGYISKYTNEAAMMMQTAAIKNIAVGLPIAVKNGSDLEARTMTAFANTMSGYSMELSSCVSEHSIEHAMSAYHQNLPHGAGLIMISKAFYEFFIEKHACDDRFIEMAKMLGETTADKPQDFITGLVKLQKECSVDELKMSDYGITPDEFDKIASNSIETMGGLFECNPCEMTHDDVVEILKKSYK